MNTPNQPKNNAVAPLAKSDVQHAEPVSGGSYIRNMATGDLVSVNPAPAEQPEQE